MTSRPPQFPVLHDIEALREMARTMTDEQIAEVVGCTPRYVRAVRGQHKIPAWGAENYAGQRVIPALHDALALGALALRMTNNEIAAHLGCAVGTVQAARRHLGIGNAKQLGSEYVGELPIYRETAVMLTCPHCRWTHSTMAAHIQGAWRIDFDSKLRQEGEAVYHVPCGSAMTVYVRPLAASGAR